MSRNFFLSFWGHTIYTIYCTLDFYIRTLGPGEQCWFRKLLHWSIWLDGSWGLPQIDGSQLLWVGECDTDLSAPDKEGQRKSGEHCKHAWALHLWEQCPLLCEQTWSGGILRYTTVSWSWISAYQQTYDNTNVNDLPFIHIIQHDN